MSGFSDSVTGKIVIGVLVGAIGTLFGAFVTWLMVSDAPPVAELAPSTLEATALQPISFTAEGSSDPEGGALRYDWALNGLPFGSNLAANCSPGADGFLVNCRFVMPGTHAVSVSVTDEAGLAQAATASVTVTVAGGYVSLYLRAPGDAEGQAAAETALLYAIDWGEAQSQIGRPVILYDPEQGSPVFAATIERNVEKAKAALAGDGAPVSLKIAGSGLRPAVRDLIAIQAADADLSIIFFDLPAAEVIVGIKRGIGEGGFILTDSPAAFDVLRNRWGFSPAVSAWL